MENNEVQQASNEVKTKKISFGKYFADIKLWQGLAILFIVVSIFLFFLKPGCSATGFSILSPENAAQKAVSYLNENILRNSNASIKSINESNGMYFVELLIEGRTYETYITKDGSYLFLKDYAIDLNEKIETEPTEKNNAQATYDAPNSDKPKVLLFTMSYCPYGNTAEDAMKPAYNLLKDKIDFEPHYVIYKNYPREDMYDKYCIENGTYCSMHGIQELNQDIRELCVWKYQKDKFWSFISEMNTKCNYNNADTCWEAVATSIGVDVAKVKSCESNEKVALAKDEYNLNQEYGVTGSPTLIINGKIFSGSRTPESYKKGICSGFNTQPSECNQTLSSTETAASGGCGG